MFISSVWYLSLHGDTDYRLLDMEFVLKITFYELEKMKHESVTDYCRALMNEGLDPKTSIEVYREDMLCLTVKSIEEGSKIMPNNCQWTKYNKTRRKGGLEHH